MRIMLSWHRDFMLTVCILVQLRTIPYQMDPIRIHLWRINGVSEMARSEKGQRIEREPRFSTIYRQSYAIHIWDSCLHALSLSLSVTMCVFVCLFCQSDRSNINCCLCENSKSKLVLLLIYFIFGVLSWAILFHKCVRVWVFIFSVRYWWWWWS